MPCSHDAPTSAKQFAHLPDWAEFAAQDADGTWWAYEAHPNRHDHGWYENEVGRYQRLEKEAPNPDWERALIKVRKSAE